MPPIRGGVHWKGRGFLRAPLLPPGVKAWVTLRLRISRVRVHSGDRCAATPFTFYLKMLEYLEIQPVQADDSVWITIQLQAGFLALTRSVF